MEKKIEYRDIRQSVADAVKEAGISLSGDVRHALELTLEKEQAAGSTGRLAMSRILENLSAAEAACMPMCQDTGMVIVFADIGTEAPVNLGDLDRAVQDGVKQAYAEGFFRKSIVEDPVFSRKNTGNNLPAVMYHSLVPGRKLSINLMLKGFGSENCSGLAMINPTAGSRGVIDAVVGIVAAAGGKPCPPIVVGVGLGGTADQAMQMSKRALLRSLDEPNPDESYARLEKDILVAINALGIGPGGLGGAVTALAVKIKQSPTHIAGLPVGVSISCWADRKASILLMGTTEASQGAAE